MGVGRSGLAIAALLDVQVVVLFILKEHLYICLVFLSGLSFAPIAFFSEGEVEIVAIKADPITFSSLI